MARMRGSSRAIVRGVKALDTSRRSRVWSGGSSERNDGLSLVRRGAVGATRDLSALAAGVRVAQHGRAVGVPADDDEGAVELGERRGCPQAGQDRVGVRQDGRVGKLGQRGPLERAHARAAGAGTPIGFGTGSTCAHALAYRQQQVGQLPGLVIVQVRPGPRGGDVGGELDLAVHGHAGLRRGAVRPRAGRVRPASPRPRPSPRRSSREPAASEPGSSRPTRGCARHWPPGRRPARSASASGASRSAATRAAR